MSISNETNILTCNRDDPNSLCLILLDLYANPTKISTTSNNAFSYFKENFSIRSNGVRYINCINSEIKRE